MRAFVTTGSPQIVIALSRRNLLTLLDKLDRPESARTLVSRDFFVNDDRNADGLLVIVAENDGDHYRDRSPGPATPETELAIASHDADAPELATAISGWADRAPASVAGIVGQRRRRHEPGRLHPWVFRQHQVWVDRHGVEHEIESMPRDYVRNVMGFCERNAWRVWWAVASDDLLDDIERVTELANVEPENARLQLLSVIEDFGREASRDPIEWLQATPLHAALRRRAGLGEAS